MDSRDHSGSESMRVTPADTEPSTKPGSKPPQRARRSSAPSLVYPSESERARPDGRDHIQSHAVHMQSTFSPRMWPRSVHVKRGSPCPGTPGNLWRSTPDGGNHVELCDRHVETRGPKGIRINWGSRRFMGRPLKPPSGHSRRGIPFPTLHQRRPRPGEKLSGVSAFVGVKGEDIRTLRAKRPEASAVCRKAPGPRPHPVPVSHTQLHAIPMESTYTPHVLHVRGHAQSTYVEPRGPHGVQRRRGN
jgi:hypothetical protein